MFGSCVIFFHIFGLRTGFCAFFFSTHSSHIYEWVGFVSHSGRLGQRYVLYQPMGNQFFLFYRKNCTVVCICLGIWMGFFSFQWASVWLKCVLHIPTVFFFFVIFDCLLFCKRCLENIHLVYTRGVWHCCAMMVWNLSDWGAKNCQHFHHYKVNKYNVSYAIFAKKTLTSHFLYAIVN